MAGFQKERREIMMTFTEFPLVQAIGWTLLHALWQGILIALVLRLLLFLIPNRAAVLRYGLSVGAIFLMLLWAAVTCWQHLPAEGSLLSAEIAPLAIDGIPDSNEVLYSSEGISAEKSAFSLVDVSNRLQPLLPYLVGIWLLGVLFWSIRFLGSMIYLYRLPRRHVWQPDAAWQRKLTALKKQLAISQQVRLLISSKIQEPLTMGFLRPVILIPASLLSNLPPEQIEAILLHELAHIRRADYVVNLLLSIVEILFFYHPAYWWISRQVKQEREPVAMTRC
jgi:Zn-dependent protease with chaperone function